MAARRVRMPPLAKMTFGVLVIVGVGLLLKGVISPGPPARCVFSCAKPPTAAPIQAEAQATFTSPTYGFSFAYPPEGHHLNLGGDGVTGYEFDNSNGDFVGQVLVTAGRGQQQLAYIVGQEAKSLSGSEIENMNLANPMLGAEIGFESGVGNLYTGEFTDSVGDVTPVQIGILAVQHGGEWVSMVGIGISSSSNSTSPIFSVFDGILDEWQWTT